MHWSAASEVILSQVVHEANPKTKADELFLRQRFQKKLSHHINLLQYHQLRQDRFIASQKRVLEKQINSVSKTKQYLDNKQQKADTNRKYSLKERSKRVEADLTRWEEVVQKNRKSYNQRIDHSTSVIKNWTDKLEESSSRKSIIIGQFTKRHKQKVEQRESRVKNFLEKEENKYKNPQERKSSLEIDSRYSQQRTDRKKTSRVSTQNIFNKKRGQQEQFLEKSLLKVIQKEQRINEARYMKQYLQQRKKKTLQDKQQNIRRLRQQKMDSIKSFTQQRNQILDQKYNNSRKKPNRNKSSLPQINGTKGVKIAIAGPGEQWRNKQSHLVNPWNAEIQEIKSCKNYDRIITEKLKDVSMLMRKNRNI